MVSTTLFQSPHGLWLPHSQTLWYAGVRLHSRTLTGFRLCETSTVQFFGESLGTLSMWPLDLSKHQETRLSYSYAFPPSLSPGTVKKSLGMRLIPSSQFGRHCDFLALLTSGSEYMYQWAESKQFDWMAQLSLSQQLRTPQYARVNVAAELGSGLTCLPTLPLHTVNWLWGMEYVSVCWEIWSYCHKMSSSPSQGSSTSQRTTTGENCSKMQVTV